MYNLINNFNIAKEDKMFRENIIAELKEKINKEPDNVENYKNLANYYIGSEDLNSALGVYKQILKLTPYDYQSLVNLGSIYFYKKNYMEAIDCYHKSTIKEPDNYAGYYNLGNVYAEIDNFELAYTN